MLACRADADHSLGTRPETRTLRKTLAMENAGSLIELVQAWLDAATDLGIDVVAPFTLRVDAQELECVALVSDFGGVSGMVLLQGGVPEWEEVRDLLEGARELGYGFSFVGKSYSVYDRGLFVDTLNDWEWRRGTDTAPAWYSGAPWTA